MLKFEARAGSPSIGSLACEPRAIEEGKTPWVHDIDHTWFLFVTSESEMELGQAMGISILYSKKAVCA